MRRREAPCTGSGFSRPCAAPRAPSSQALGASTLRSHASRPIGDDPSRASLMGDVNVSDIPTTRRFGRLALGSPLGGLFDRTMNAPSCRGQYPARGRFRVSSRHYDKPAKLWRGVPGATCGGAAMLRVPAPRPDARAPVPAPRWRRVIVPAAVPCRCRASLSAPASSRRGR